MKLLIGFQNGIVKSFKIGVKNRNITKEDQFSSDIAAEAVEAICLEHAIDKANIDYLIVVQIS
jgi:3-oxoacyl-[acyl-carrier-protein] synthase III